MKHVANFSVVLLSNTSIVWMGTLISGTSSYFVTHDTLGTISGAYSLSSQVLSADSGIICYCLSVSNLLFIINLNETSLSSLLNRLRANVNTLFPVLLQEILPEHSPYQQPLDLHHFLAFLIMTMVQSRFSCIMVLQCPLFNYKEESKCQRVLLV